MPMHRIVRRGLAERTADSYTALFERRLLPAFGNTAIREITASDINKFLRKLVNDGKCQKKSKKTGKEENKGQTSSRKISGTYCLKYYQQLNELFSYAQRTGIIVVNPCDLVEPPKKDTKEAQYYEPHECMICVIHIVRS